MSPKLQIRILIFLLTVIGLGAAFYKYTVLGFPLIASDKETIWQIEAKINFIADGGPVTVSINLPDENPSRHVVSADLISPGFTYQVVEENGVRLGRWQADEASGLQTIYARSESYFVSDKAGSLAAIKSVPLLELSSAQAVTAQALIEQLTETSPHERIVEVLQLLNRVNDEQVDILLRDFSGVQSRNRLAGELLQLAGFPVRTVSGIYLEEKARSQHTQHFLDVMIDDTHVLYDTREVAVVPWNRVILLRTGDEPLLEVFGGRDSEVSYATTKMQRAAFTSAVKAAAHSHNPLIDFSIYSLPLSEQNTFKLLLVIPLGALVVVILRNLVGIRTSGTFMPVLIALTFLQTSLFTGLMLFLVVVGVGLFLRSYLSRLNLLLVPRIASVLVFVIIIYAAIGIISSKMGWQAGLKVTFFPMIILSWTIERMSILWDEEGGHEVMVQGGGSLLTASLAFLLMSNTFVADTIFLYPELLLVLLAVIISIGSYSGYRLSDLRRFEPMERY
mgnify:FL=1